MNKKILLSLITLLSVNALVLTNANLTLKMSKVETREMSRVENIRPTGVWLLGSDDETLP